MATMNVSQFATELKMPATADGPIPALLSQTGAFKDIRRLIPADELLPYELVVPFWSDHAIKTRWIAVPSGQTVKFSPTGEWVFPAGTVLVKHFDLTLDETKAGTARRLETRIIVRAENGGVYGVTYKWRADNSDADLVQAHLRPLVQIVGPQFHLRKRVLQIFQNDIGFGDDASVMVHRRHHRLRVQLGVPIFVIVEGKQIDVVAFVRDVLFREAQARLLRTDRTPIMI